MSDPRAFDPGALAELPDLHAALAELRAVSPVLLLDNGFVAVTGQAAALDALRHPGCASSPIALRYMDRLPPGPAHDEMAHRINFLDPPDHPRVRGLVSKVFTPRRVAALRPWMEETATGLVAGWGDRDEVDVLALFAHQLPSLVISEMLGVPAADRDQLTHWSDDVSPLLGLAPSADELTAALAAADQFHAYVEDLLAERRRNPGDDLLSALLGAEEGGERLTHPELMSLAATLYSAGHRTTRDLFCNGMAVLLSDADLWAGVVEGRWRTAAVIEEFLRHQTPTQFVARVPLDDLEVDGVAVGAWQPLLVYLGAANRDPAAWADPDRFDPTRFGPERSAGPSSLSFAFGAHYCLGASLARSEAEVMLTTLVSRFPAMRLAGSVRWHQRGPFRGVDELVVSPGG